MSTNRDVGIRVAVAGGTGRTGRRVVSALQRAGHQTVVMSRSSGVDLVAGQGVDRALADVDAVIDVTNTLVADDDAAREFFANATGHLLEAEQRAGVAHHVLLSILGVDRVHGNAHYVGKRHQEHLVQEGPVPYTIVRAAQFHDFAAMVVSWTRHGQTAVIPPLLVQPVAVSDVADVLATSAAAPARSAPSTSPARAHTIWWTWHGAHSPGAASPSPSSRAGTTVRSASRWPGTSCFPGLARSSPQPPSMHGSRPQRRSPQVEPSASSTSSTLLRAANDLGVAVHAHPAGQGRSNAHAVRSRHRLRDRHRRHLFDDLQL